MHVGAKRLDLILLPVYYPALKFYSIETMYSIKDKHSDKHTEAGKVPKITLQTKRPDSPMPVSDSHKRIKFTPPPALADAYNLTTTNRDLDNYSNKFKIKIMDVISNYYKIDNKVSVLDSGCGQGVFCSDLLSIAEGKLDKVFGISKDYFSSIAKITKRWPSNFVFYHGTAQEVLQKEKIEVNLIFDVWGAFSYSLEKMDLLKLYYDSLKLAGRAYIYLGSCHSAKDEYSPEPCLSFKNDDGSISKPLPIIEALVTRYPGYFASNYSQSNVLIMKKMTHSYPIKHNFEHSSPFLGFTLTVPSKVSSLKEAIAGNAAMPSHITIKPKP